MKYLAVIAVALAAEQAAARALPFSDLTAAAAHPDYAKVEAERALGTDEATLQKRYPAFGVRLPGAHVHKRTIETNGFLTRILEKVGLNDVQIAQAKVVIHEKSEEADSKSTKRSIQTSDFLTRILEKVGLNDNQLAQAKDIVALEATENESAAVDKRSIESSDFLTRILEKVGLNDNQLAQVKDVVVLQALENEVSKPSEKRAETGENAFLTRILEKAGLNGGAVHQAQTLVATQSEQAAAKAAVSSKRSLQDSFMASILTKIGLNEGQQEEFAAAVDVQVSAQVKRDEGGHEDDQLAEQIAAEAKLELLQDHEGRPAVAARLVRMEEELVKALEKWKRAPGTVEAYQEWSERSNEVRALEKRKALCMT